MNGMQINSKSNKNKWKNSITISMLGKSSEMHVKQEKGLYYQKYRKYV
jgi:hypothetical protein